MKMLFKDSSGNVIPGGELDLRDVDIEQTYGPGHMDQARKTATTLIKRRYVRDRLISAGRGRALIKEMDHMNVDQVADMLTGAALMHHKWTFGAVSMTQAQAMFKLPVEDWPHSIEAMNEWDEIVLSNPEYTALAIDCFAHNGSWCPLCMEIVAYLKNEHPLNLFLRDLKPHGEGCRCGEPGAGHQH